VGLLYMHCSIGKVHKSCFEEPTSYAAPGQHVYSTGIRVCLAKYITQTASIRHHVLAYAITRDKNGVVICSSIVCILPTLHLSDIHCFVVKRV
jgi:hypothetical protein